jgi:hypothetical protein
MGTTTGDPCEGNDEVNEPQTLGQSPLRQRDAALQQARVAYRAEHGRWPSRSWKLGTANAVPPAPPPSINFDAAYPATGGEIGPIASRWEGNRAVWLLTTNDDRRGRYVPRNP